LDIVSLVANEEETSFAKKLGWGYWFKSTKWQHKKYWEDFILLGVIFWFIRSWKEKSTKDSGRQIFIFGMRTVVIFIELPIFHTWRSRNNFLPRKQKLEIILAGCWVDVHYISCLNKVGKLGNKSLI
jgi:hypothetical protein